MMNSKSTTKKNHFANDGTFGLFAHLRKFLMYYFNRQSTNTVTTMFIFSKHLEIPIGLNKMSDVCYRKKVVVFLILITGTLIICTRFDFLSVVTKECCKLF